MTLSVLAPTSAAATVPAAEGDGPHIPGPNDFWLPLFGPEGFEITEQMVWGGVAVAIICTVMVVMSNRAKVVPSYGQWLFEGFYNIPRNSIARDMIGTKEFKKFVPLLASLFSLILLTNLFGVLPPVMNPVSGAIGFPIAFTAVVYVVYHWIGFSRHGFIGYFKHMVPAGVPLWISPVILLLELVTYFIFRPLTLALRLFGNMFAGHMLILLLAGAAGYFLLEGDGIMRLMSVPTYLMAGAMFVFEMLIQFLQAFVFTLLAASYIAGALADDH